MTYELACWLAAKLDIFDLKVRGGKTKKGRANNDLYYSSGWAHGYKQAQTDARKASRGPRLPPVNYPTDITPVCCAGAPDHYSNCPNFEPNRTAETSAEHVHRWNGKHPDAFCEDCLAERYPTENPEGA